MQPEKNTMDDLEYLSQKGFEQIPVNDSDLEDLKKKVRAKSFSSNHLYLMLGSLLLGVGIGAILFFGLHDEPEKRPGLNEIITLGAPVGATSPAEKIIELDTVQVVIENFINPEAVTPKVVTKMKSTKVLVDSVDVIASKPLDLSLLTAGEMNEEKLKFMINSPVFYLYDMKITNYTTLYFKKNRFIKFTGVSAAFSNVYESEPAGSELKQSAEYYLHEEIATALLLFKKGKYDQAINSLKTVASYNDKDINCDFYLAMCYYYKKNYSQSTELFDRCINNSNNTFLQEATYYKALSFYESGKKEEAKELFRKIAGEKEFYAEKAKGYIKD